MTFYVKEERNFFSGKIIWSVTYSIQDARAEQATTIGHTYIDLLSQPFTPITKIFLFRYQTISESLGQQKKRAIN